jgi:hypothetical protein
MPFICIAHMEFLIVNWISYIDFLFQHTGARRLQDARVVEYQPQRVPKNDILVPDWCTPAYNELGLHN